MEQGRGILAGLNNGSGGGGVFFQPFSERKVHCREDRKLGGSFAVDRDGQAFHETWAELKQRVCCYTHVWGFVVPVFVIYRKRKMLILLYSGYFSKILENKLVGKQHPWLLKFLFGNTYLCHARHLIKHFRVKSFELDGGLANFFLIKKPHRRYVKQKLWSWNRDKNLTACDRERWVQIMMREERKTAEWRVRRTFSTVNW